MIPEGIYQARGLSLLAAESSKSKTPVMVINFRIETEGTSKGAMIEYDGYLTPGTQARTIESLYACGWDGENASTISTNLVNIVIEHEDQVDKDNKPTGRKVARVRWVNDLERGGGRYAAVDAGRAQQMMQEAKGLLLQHKASLPTKPQGSGTSFEHGANAGQQATGSRKF